MSKQGMVAKHLTGTQRFDLAMAVAKYANLETKPFDGWKAALEAFSRIVGTELTRNNLNTAFKIANVDPKKVVKSQYTGMLPPQMLTRRIETLEAKVESLDKQLVDLQKTILTFVTNGRSGA